MSGILGEGVWSNAAANSWQRRRMAPEAHVEGTIELRYTDKEWFFFPPHTSCIRDKITEMCY